jgi:hypothetical protein
LNFEIEGTTPLKVRSTKLWHGQSKKHKSPSSKAPRLPCYPAVPSIPLLVVDFDVLAKEL